MTAGWFALVALSAIGGVLTPLLAVVIVSLLLDRRRHRFMSRRGAVRR